MARDLQRQALEGGPQHSDPAVCAKLHQITLDEVKQGVMSGPYSVEDLDQVLVKIGGPSPPVPSSDDAGPGGCRPG